MTNILKLSDVSKSFGPAQIIKNLNLDIEKGERHAIIGPNGAGKSTLFHLISGHYKPTSGKITLNNEEISDLDPHSINRKGLARSFQVTNIFPKMSVAENIRCGMLWSKNFKYSIFKLLDSLINKFCIPFMLIYLLCPSILLKPLHQTFTKFFFSHFDTSCWNSSDLTVKN